MSAGGFETEAADGDHRIEPLYAHVLLDQIPVSASLEYLQTQSCRMKFCEQLLQLLPRKSICRAADTKLFIIALDPSHFAELIPTLILASKSIKPRSAKQLDHAPHASCGISMRPSFPKILTLVDGRFCGLQMILYHQPVSYLSTFHRSCPQLSLNFFFSSIYPF